MAYRAGLRSKEFNSGLSLFLRAPPTTPAGLATAGAKGFVEGMFLDDK